MTVKMGSYDTPADIRHKADNGDGAACLATGNFFSKGDLKNDIPCDPMMAAAYYERGMNAGNMDCQYALACAYLTGSGVAKNTGKHLQLLQDAAERGGAKALAALGKYALLGTQLPKDNTKAYDSFRRFHQVMIRDRGQMHVFAVFDRNVLYYPLCLYFGVGCEANPVRAHAALNELSQAGFHAAKNALAKNYISDAALVRAFAPGLGGGAEARIDLEPVTGKPTADTPESRAAAEADRKLLAEEGD